jgi:predicted ester cyclase
VVPCLLRAKEDAHMSTEENKAIVRRLYEEAITQNKLEVFDEIIDHAPFPEQDPGLEGFKGVFAMVLSAFPDYHSTVEDQIAEGDKVVTRFSSQGTHQGEFIGIAPTGNRVRVTGIDIARVEEGKIVESWSEADMLGMMTQLGVIPEPGQSEEAAPT